MEDVKLAMMVIELQQTSHAKMIVKQLIVKCVKMTNRAQNVNLDLFLLILIEY